MIGERLFDLRKDNQMTQKELAKILGCSSYTISSWESEHTTPNDEMKVKISRVFQVSSDYLLGLIRQPLPPQGSAEVKRCLFLPENLSDQALQEIRSYADYVVRRERGEL